MADNLSLYNKVATVPQEACKGFTNGSFSGTDINPMWRIKTLTEHFGVCGIGWYIDEVDRWTETVEGEQLVFVKIHLFIKEKETGEWSKPIVGIGGNKTLQIFPAKNGKPEIRKVSDESYKMAYTDAISVACKALGFGGDIYWQNDPTKYTRYYNEQPQEQAPNYQPYPGNLPQYQQSPSDKPSGRGRKKQSAPVETLPPDPAVAQMPQNTAPMAREIDIAMQELRFVTSQEGLNALWKAHPNLQKDVAFINAVKANPFHPNNLKK